jgi:hypothetical protein
VNLASAKPGDKQNVGQGSREPVLGAVACFLGVTALGPLFARPLASVVGLPLTALPGRTGVLARGNAMRNLDVRQQAALRRVLVAVAQRDPAELCGPVPRRHADPAGGH